MEEASAKPAATTSPPEVPPKTPRWVWALVGILVAALAIFLILHLIGAAPKGH
jgi:hypothetical protein